MEFINLAERLHIISAYRQKLFEYIEYCVPVEYLSRNTYLFHGFMIFTTFLIIISIFSQLHSLTLFSLHPILMSIGALIFLSEGMVSFRNDSILEVLSPIMQFNRKTKIRSIHQTLQSIGTAFLIIGTLFIVANKIEFEKTIIPMTIHSIIGVFTVILLAVQAFSGIQKLNQLELGKRKIFRWHGDLGLLLWDVICLSIVTGLMTFLKLRLSNIFVVIAVMTSWLIVHCQLKRPSILKSELYSSTIDSSSLNVSSHRLSSLNNMNIASNGTGTTMEPIPDVEEDEGFINNDVNEAEEDL